MSAASSSNVANKETNATKQNADIAENVSLFGSYVPAQKYSSQANQAPDKPNHDRFDWINLCVLALTFVAASIAAYQTKRLSDLTEQLVKDAKETGDKQLEFTEKSNKFNRDVLISTNRARVGIYDAKVVGTITLGKPIEITSIFRNTGKEPARKLDIRTQRTVYNTKNGLSQSDGIEISNFMSQCMITGESDGGGISYPSSGPETSGATIEIPGSEIDEAFISGEKTLLNYGCATYVTVTEVKHSTFCFRFQNGKTSPDHLSICPFGNEAD